MVYLCLVLLSRHRVWKELSTFLGPKARLGESAHYSLASHGAVLWLSGISGSSTLIEACDRHNIGL